MTAITTDAISIPVVASAKKSGRAMTKAQLRREVEAMSETMVEEQGLLNHAQAGILLDVSTRRIGELVELGKLTRFDFMGRTYVSMREVRARREMDLKAGRPKRGVVERVKVSIKAALKTDREQMRQGGYAGPYVDAQLRGKRKKK
jgi:hypothetical protein